MSLTLACLLFLASACSGASRESAALPTLGHAPVEMREESALPTPADHNLEAVLTAIAGRSVGLVVNHTAVIGQTHLADTLLSLGVDVRCAFAPEHGFRGTADDGAHIDDQRDAATGLPIISLYGSHKKPTPADLDGIELLVFDIQDVGTRFYTYLSTMHYVMEAGAENGVPVLILDRPNPNGHIVDGPVLDTARFRSFVGMHAIPVLHGMTLGELARMINGEAWLAGGKTCDLQVLTCSNYTHSTAFDLPIFPSPNLRSMEAILLYPSLCLFEGTTVSIGRGTPTPFRVIGHPDFSLGSFAFTPQPGPGSANPKHKGVACYGQNLSGLSAEALRAEGRLNLTWLKAYHDFLAPRTRFFLANGYFDKLAGTDDLRLQLDEGKTEEEIRQSWQTGLEAFRQQREKYLLYP